MDTTDSAPIEPSTEPSTNDPISPTKSLTPVPESVTPNASAPLALEIDVRAPLPNASSETDPLEYLSAQSGGSSSSSDSADTPSSTCSEQTRLAIANVPLNHPPDSEASASAQSSAVTPGEHKSASASEKPALAPASSPGAPPARIAVPPPRQSLTPNQNPIPILSEYPSADSFQVAYKVLVDPLLEPGNPECIYRFDGHDEVFLKHLYDEYLLIPLLKR